MTGQSPDQAAQGARLVEAVAVMDRLRSPGGCPWDAEQTHESLRRYLLEETYELLEAIEDGDRAAMLEELGDVLLQVLFHARVAGEHATEPFGIDDVSDALVRKLVGRHPHVFADDPEVRDAASQQRRWEELKHAEKGRTSLTDGVAHGQPAAALTAKLVSRARRAGLPDDLLPGDDPLFAAVAARGDSGDGPEIELRDRARKFADDVRAAEQAARDDGVEPRGMEAHAWRRYFPAGNP